VKGIKEYTQIKCKEQDQWVRSQTENGGTRTKQHRNMSFCEDSNFVQRTLEP